MGLVLDSSILIAAERAAQPVGDLLTSLPASHGPVDIMLSAISVIELEHGFWRSHTSDL